VSFVRETGAERRPFVEVGDVERDRQKSRARLDRLYVDGHHASASGANEINDLLPDGACGTGDEICASSEVGQRGVSR
jgi:hypothetical protein